ncbi:HupE/UreJ family protein [Azospirillum sp. YIM B02556]|uniref:HupE/UreJ family protein n=1 Tax=Azospirillum endophyticum TaxID=2800326 RepID=A0ABS1FCQ3_9PROT|nr:HupE/UreJ family protein [Azospirillum endophyticum]MBK1841007.1 HupE/UreJ family protein [Azospirillum endophyticum]
MNKLLSAGLAGLAVVTLALPAAAHTGHADGMGFLAGFLHPLGGLDHLLAMVAVGLWAAQTGGRALWMLPVAFVTMLTGGALAGMSGIEVPMVEAGIAASVAVLGLLVLLNKRVPVSAGMALVGVFAVFHGHAHGAEMPATAQPMLFGAGFILSTVLLHGAGIAAMAIGRGVARRSARPTAA